MQGAVNLTPAQAQSACTTANSATLPTTPVAADAKANAVILPLYDNSARWILGPADFGGNVVKTALVVAPGSNNQVSYTVQVNFTKAGSAAFDAMAAQRNRYYDGGAAPSANPNYYQSLEAIELDGVVESVPQIQNSSYNGTAVISGGTAGFTAAQANSLALKLRYGSLPVRFTPQSVQTVSASIGSDSLRAGLLAGLGGLVIVLLYMVLYYRALGLVVIVGLGIGGALLYSIITELSQSSSLALTLAGVTGIIVSIGITVDSYVVYFERLKDEIRAGRTIRQSTERGFARAFRTVLTADFVTFLAALILYVLTVGDVKGFAFMLGLSTLLDVFTAYFFIRPAVILVGRRKAFIEARFFGVARGLGAAARSSA
ncbi:MAG: SecD/SecF family protein translocase subunit [Acidimicrobiales bacterium]